jgi:hypothetical protein
MLASILFVSWCPIKISASGGDSTTDNFDWILEADRYCFNAVDFTCQKDWKIVSSVPASHAQQWPQGVASYLQGLVKDGVSYILCILYGHTGIAWSDVAKA